MESGGKNYDLHREVNAWLAVAGENLCDRATAELRKRMLASVETECQRLENEGLSREIAVKQAIGEIGDPEVAKRALEAKHLTKEEYIKTGRFYYGTLGISYFKLVPAFVLLLGIALLLLHFGVIDKYNFYLVVGCVLGTLLLDLIVYLLRVTSDSIPIFGMAGQWEKRSQHLRRQWIYLLWLVNFHAIFLLGEAPDKYQFYHEGPIYYIPQHILLFTGNLCIPIYYRMVKSLAIKVKALENDGFEYVLLPGGSPHVPPLKHPDGVV